jgi:hypothetical protein
MIWSAVKDILSSYLVIQLIYRNDSGGKEPDERQTQLALDFYNTFIIDLFRLSPLRQNDPIDSKDYEQLLLFHISSLLTIVNLLQEINLKGQLDTEEEDGKCKIWGKGIDRGDVQDGVLKALNELGENLDKHQSTYQRYYFNKHY